MSGNIRTMVVVSFLVFAFSLAGYAQDSTKVKNGEVDITEAQAVVYPTGENTAHGDVMFIKTPEGMKVIVDMYDLAPGKHGIHIHEFGDCSALDASSAGGHFNPEGKPHGGLNNPERHVGDLGNITAKDDGSVHAEFIDPLLTFSGSHSIIGRAVIVHQGEDDLKTQPSGNSGPRIACGVIGIVQ